jgi:hypothetical protein
VPIVLKSGTLRTCPGLYRDCFFFIHRKCFGQKVRCSAFLLSPYCERWLSRDISAVAGSLRDKFFALNTPIKERPSKNQNYILKEITTIQGVSGGIVNILGGGSVDYSE